MHKINGEGEWKKWIVGRVCAMCCVVYDDDTIDEGGKEVSSTSLCASYSVFSVHAS